MVFYLLSVCVCVGSMKTCGGELDIKPEGYCTQKVAWGRNGEPAVFVFTCGRCAKDFASKPIMVKGPYLCGKCSPGDHAAFLARLEKSTTPTSGTVYCELCKIGLGKQVETLPGCSMCAQHAKAIEEKWGQMALLK